MVPHAIAALASVLKNDGFEASVFDATRYESTTNSNKTRVKMFNAVPYNFKDRGIEAKESDVFYDFREKIESFKPDLIAISIVEDTYALGAKLLESVRDTNIPVVAGGVFCTYATDKVLANQDIDYAIRGEGEKAILDLCRALRDKKSPYEVNNLSYRANGKIVSNPVNPLVNCDDIPFPDYSVFDEDALYRPMMGDIYRTVSIELHRGCPYNCGYCNSAANNHYYKEKTGQIFFRKRSLKSFSEELDHMVKNYDPEFIYFISDTFLLLSDAEFAEFCDIYSKYKIPFFANTRAETVTEKRVKMLEDINCARFNVGLEHGNEEFRRKVVGRQLSNEVILNAIKLVGESKISTVTNNIIGFPDETRDLIFDTINLNRPVEKYCDSVSCTIFSPYHGTSLRDRAIKSGYLDDNVVVDSACFFSSLLKMPNLSVEEIDGLHRTFTMYVRMPLSEWPRIERAEKLDDEGNKIYQEIRAEFQDKYLSKRTHKKIRKMEKSGNCTKEQQNGKG